MSTVTTTGSGTPVTLLVSSGSNLVVPQNGSVSLLQGSSVTVTGSGHTILFLGRVNSSNDAQCQVTLTIDGTTVYEDATGEQIVVKAVLSSGSHTVTFTAFALSNDVTAEVFGLTAIDLGL